MKKDGLEQYEKYVRGKLSVLTPIFARAAMGDYSNNLALPDEEDEFIELYTGVQVMIEVIRSQLAELNTVNQSLEEKVADLQNLINERKRAEEALQVQQLYFKQLFEQSPFPIVMLNASDAILDINNAFNHFFQYSIDEIRGQQINDIIIPEFLLAQGKDFTRASQQGAVIKQETIRKRKDGTLVHVDLTVSPIIRENKVAGIYAMYIDITERKRAEEALRESEERFRSLFDRMMDGVYRSTHDGRFVEINEAMVRMFGYSSKEEMLKVDIKKELYFATQDRDSLFLDTGQEKIEIFRMRRKDGSEIWVEDHGQYVHDEQGRVLFHEGTLRDVTERVRIEGLVIEQQKYLRKIIDTDPNFIFAKDREGQFTLVNQAVADAYGTTVENLLGKTDADFNPNVDEVEFFRKKDLEVMDSRSMEFIREEKITDAGGKLRWLQTVKIPIVSEDGKVHQVLGVATDITERKHAEEVLRTKEEELRRLFEIMPMGILVLDNQRNVIDVNPSLVKILGISKEGLFRGEHGKQKYLRGNGTPMLHEEFPGVRALKEQRVITNVEMGLVKEHGNTVWTEVSAAPLSDDGVLLVTADITERKRTEQALRESEESYRSLFDSMMDGVYRSTHEGKFVDVNPAFVKMFGYSSKEEMLQIDIKKELYFAPSDRDSLFLDTGQEKIEVFRMRRKDGSEIWVEDHGWYVHDEQGNVVFHEGTLRDVTERKLAEEELRLMAHTLESISEIATITGIENHFIFVNKAFSERYGYSKEDVIGKHVSILFAREEPREKMEEVYKQTLRGGWKGELLNRTSDGTVFPIFLSTSLIHDEKGNIVGLVGIAEDITERKQTAEVHRQLEQQLVQSQKLESLGTLAGGIAHDFNNILAIIMGHSSLMERVQSNPEKLSQSVKIIQKATERGASLVKQLLTFARKSDAVLESVRLNETIKEITKLLCETFPKTIVVETTLQDNLPSVLADATQLHQVILNLCVNARDAMPKGGTLSISTITMSGEAANAAYPKATAREYALIRVMDTGFGMDERTKKRIFEPFFTTKGVGKGTGLGLALVYSIVDNHGGIIDVESQVGKGTAFNILLPTEEQRFESATIIKKEVQDVSGGIETILLIEDEDLLSDLVKAILVSKGYTVLIARDGEEGLALYIQQRKQIDLVITDLGLPKLGGDEVLKRIKIENPHAEIIVASGFIDPHVKSEMYKAGAKYFIQKSYLPDEVLRTIRNVLDVKK